MFKQPKVVTLWLQLTLANIVPFQVLLPLPFVKWFTASSHFSCDEDRNLKVSA